MIGIFCFGYYYYEIINGVRTYNKYPVFNFPSQGPKWPKSGVSRYYSIKILQGEYIYP